MRIIDVMLKCVNCGVESKQEVIRSFHVFGGTRHLDTRFDNGQVNLHMQVCPNCHYCNFDISEKSKSAKTVMESAEYKTLAKSKLDAQAKQYITVAMVNEQDKKSVEAGRLYLAASWVFEDNKDSKNADKYRQLAVKNLMKNLKKDENGHLTLQCIDLLRKNKEFGEAQKLLNNLKKDAGETFMHVYFSEPDVSLTELTEDKEVSSLLKIAKYEQQLVENKDFSDHLMSELVEEKMDFGKFYSLLLKYKEKPMSHSQSTIYAPTLYNLDKDWFNAVVEYLKTGKETELHWRDYTTKKIKEAYSVEKPDYIDAVVILESLRKAGYDSYTTFNPYIVE